ncbi:helix-turn-helix domain-containing protein [Spirillospora sp. NPDC047279]|uniref:PucR family transcriptional regulator n=1 Tax=Spirillospora sp. NPDC047279 TaxID=3155478 RepID=UPI00340DF374
MDGPGQTIELDLDLDLDSQLRLSLTVRRVVPEIVREAVAEVRRKVPEYAGDGCAQGIEIATGHAVDQFVELIERSGPPSGQVAEFFRKVGSLEAEAGRGLREWQAAVNVSARTAVRHLAQAMTAVDIPTAVYGQVIEEAFAYLNRLTRAAAQGHAETAGEAFDTGLHRRRVLIERLVEGPPPAADEVTELAAGAGWPVPRRAAVVALRGGDPGPPWRLGPPADVLDGRHRTQPCLVVPDPEGPGRRRALENMLRGRLAAVGPAVPVDRLARSLHWARQALSLGVRGLVPGDRLIVATEHLPTLSVLRNRDLVAGTAARRLAPLLELRPKQRYRFAETLSAVLECGHHSAAAAERLHVHPQTVRLRMRRLEELFGDSLHDPALHLELLMVLRAWLAEAAPGADPPWFVAQPGDAGDAGGAGSGVVRAC